MKRIILLSLFTLIFVASVFGGTTRSFNQKLGFASGDITEVITNTSSSHAPNYLVTADILQTTGEVVSTATHNATQIRIYRAGTPGNYAVLLFLQFAAFTTQWYAGNTIRFYVEYTPTLEFVTWDYVIPTGTGSISIQNPVVIIPQPTITTKISGNITSAFSLSGVLLTCTGQPNVNTGTNGYYEFTINPGSSVTITPSKTGYYFNPVNRYHENVTENVTGANFAMIKNNPNAASTPTPANGITGVEPTIGFLSWNFVQQPYNAPPTGFKVFFPDGATTYTLVPYVEGITAYSMPIPLLDYSTTYTWRVVPTNSRGKGEDASIPDSGEAQSKADGDGVVPWSFTTQNPQWITPGFTEDVDPDGPGPLPTFYVDTPPSTELEPVPVITYSIVSLSSVPFFIGSPYVTDAFALNMSAPIDCYRLEISVPAGTWYAVAWYNGMWNPGNPYPCVGPGTIVWLNVPFGGKDDIPLIISGGGDPLLPVELSSFTATFSAGFFVQLNWTVQSETNHMGYNILRSENVNGSGSVKINDAMIESGSSVGTEITYSYRDEEVEANTNYYYWLESVDLGGTTQLFGPRMVTVGNIDTPPPITPEQIATALLSAYPNPFGSSTRIRYSLKNKSDVKFEIFNIKGQLVYNVEMNKAGQRFHFFEWDGKDNNQRPVSSGIYYYRMTSGKYTSTKKIVLVK